MWAVFGSVSSRVVSLGRAIDIFLWRSVAACPWGGVGLALCAVNDRGIVFWGAWSVRFAGWDPKREAWQGLPLLICVLIDDRLFTLFIMQSARRTTRRPHADSRSCQNVSPHLGCSVLTTGCTSSPRQKSAKNRFFLGDVFVFCLDFFDMLDGSSRCKAICAPFFSTSVLKN